MNTDSAAAPPLVSVCISAYNHEAYIEECLESVIAQTYRHIELIVIDDGSPDRTWEKIGAMRERCEQRFTRVVLRTQPNRGTCVTMGIKWAEARGKYIIGVASDDKLYPEACRLQVEYLESHPDVGLVVGTNTIIDSASRPCYWDEEQNNVYHAAEARYLSFTEYLEQVTGIRTDSPAYGTYESLVRCNHIVNGCMFRHSLLHCTEPCSPHAPLEDHWFMMQMAKVTRLHAIPEPTYCYRWHGKNTMVINREKVRRMSEQTYDYEEQRVSLPAQKKWHRIFRKVRYGYKMQRDFGPLKIYYLNNRVGKEKILELFGRAIVLRRVTH